MRLSSVWFKDETGKTKPKNPKPKNKNKDHRGDWLAGGDTELQFLTQDPGLFPTDPVTSRFHAPTTDQVEIFSQLHAPRSGPQQTDGVFNLWRSEQDHVRLWYPHAFPPSTFCSRKTMVHTFELEIHAGCSPVPTQLLLKAVRGTTKMFCV